MSDPTVDALIDHAASTQRELDRLRQAIMLLALAGIGLSIAVMILRAQLTDG